MRSLFIRILFWFLLESAVTTLVVTIASQYFVQTNLLNIYYAGLLNAHLEQAREAYERGGADGLRRFTSTFDRGFARGVHVTDTTGHDLLTGEDIASRPALAGRLSQHVTLTFVHRGAMLTKSTPDGRYRIFLPFGWGGPGPGLWRPTLFAVLLTIVALSWVLARRLSRPVLDLQRVVERFGSGDTGVRSRSQRSDEYGQLARSFDSMADRIEELVQGQRRLLLDISHELRSPLARLTLATDLLRADPHDEVSMSQIELETDRLNQLIGEILQASRPDAPETKRTFSAVRLDSLLREVVDACRIEAAEGQRLELNADSVNVFGNGELLRRAIENVLRNAVRYAPAETAVDVHLSSARTVRTAEAKTSGPSSAPDATAAEGRGAGDDVVRLTVRDRGPGVPEAALPHLFTPFYRVDADRERRTGGVGLGLAIARRAVELHGGRIIARNAQPGLEVEIQLTGRASGASAGSAASADRADAASDYSERSTSTGLTEAARRAGM